MRLAAPHRAFHPSTLRSLLRPSASMSLHINTLQQLQGNVSNEARTATADDRLPSFARPTLKGTLISV
jgi:hypothetical protein